MRSRAWLFLPVLVFVGAAFALPAAADDFDQIRMISEFNTHFQEPVHVPTAWLDLGVSVPIGTFDKRSWDPGFLARWSQEVWWEGPFALVGSVGFAFNDDSRYNESQADASSDSGFDSFVPVYSHRHTVVPFALELQIQPTRTGVLSPFVAAGPSIQYTHESRVRQDWYVITQPTAQAFVVPIPDPGFPVLQADQALTKTHFHPGVQGRAGIRARVGTGPSPLHLRVTASANVWYEHSRPITLVGGSLSFGR